MPLGSFRTCWKYRRCGDGVRWVREDREDDLELSDTTNPWEDLRGGPCGAGVGEDRGESVLGNGIEVQADELGFK